ncbi:MAG: YqeG family HAD IIIA-type phosphatase [Anaerorhabdus sp.]
MKLFLPNIYVNSFLDITTLLLKKYNIKVLVFDIDNTLMKHGNVIVDKELLDYIKKLKSLDLHIMLLSNNKYQRVSTIASKLNLDFIHFACKPTKKNFKKIMLKYRVDADEVMVVGDQMLTDILGANRLGMVSALVKPIDIKDNIPGKFSRFLEGLLWKYFERKELLVRGEYYE